MANSTVPKHGMNPTMPSPRTGGPLGTNKDAADPGTPRWFTGDTSGPLGINDHADPSTVMCRVRMMDQIPQAPTLSDIAPDFTAGKVRLQFEDLERMDVAKFGDLPSAEDRKAWFVKKLGRYERQLQESAEQQQIPVQLLAAVVSNELLDISMADVVQEDLEFAVSGSYGIAQIQVSTALRDNLIPRDAAFRTAESLGMQAVFVKGRLRIAQFAIAAAAKEIRILLDKIKANPNSAWAKKFGFQPAKAGSDQHVYDGFEEGSQVEKEAKLAEMVDAAYNSPDIIIAEHPELYKKGPIHGQNAGVVAQLLDKFDLFRPGP